MNSIYLIITSTHPIKSNSFTVIIIIPQTISSMSLSGWKCLRKHCPFWQTKKLPCYSKDTVYKRIFYIIWKPFAPSLLHSHFQVGKHWAVSFFLFIQSDFPWTMDIFYFPSAFWCLLRLCRFCHLFLCSIFVICYNLLPFGHHHFISFSHSLYFVWTVYACLREALFFLFCSKISLAGEKLVRQTTLVTANATTTNWAIRTQLHIHIIITWNAIFSISNIYEICMCMWFPFSSSSISFHSVAFFVTSCWFFLLSHFRFPHFHCCYSWKQLLHFPLYSKNGWKATRGQNSGWWNKRANFIQKYILSLHLKNFFLVFSTRFLFAILPVLHYCYNDFILFFERWCVCAFACYSLSRKMCARHISDVGWLRAWEKMFIHSSHLHFYS